MIANVLVLGASGIPGRNILSSLLDPTTNLSSHLNITVLVRPESASIPTNIKGIKTAKLDDFSDIDAFTKILTSLKPDIVVSALNAEPAPKLDNLVVDAILRYQERLPASDSRKPLYVNGYTLDLLHPSVAALPDSLKQAIQQKIDFAHRLQDLAAQSKLSYCTIVNASFLDYCLVKGYSNINLGQKTTKLIDGGTTTITGCSLTFVGDAVALVAEYYAFGSEAEQAQVTNKRLRIAETMYSGQTLLENVEIITGDKYQVTHAKSEDDLAAGKVVRYLNWAGTGASDFSKDGFHFGKDVLKRKPLDELCRIAIENGVEAFQGIGR